MNPMTELDTLKGLQASICGLDLDAPRDVYGLWPVERALALGAAMEASAGRIIAANQACPVQQAWNAICEADFTLDDTVEAQQAACISRAAQAMVDEAAENWRQRAKVVRERREAMEAERIHNCHVNPIFAPILEGLTHLSGFRGVTE
jgi:hypothetical protein